MRKVVQQVLSSLNNSLINRSFSQASKPATSGKRACNHGRTGHKVGITQPSHHSVYKFLLCTRAVWMTNRIGNSSLRKTMCACGLAAFKLKPAESAVTSLEKSFLLHAIGRRNDQMAVQE